jgi:hypothetical protein
VRQVEDGKELVTDVDVGDFVFGGNVVDLPNDAFVKDGI